MANTSILAAFERMWQHVVIALNDTKNYADEKISNTLLKTSQELTEDEINQIHNNLHTIEYVNNIFETYATDIADILGGIE